MYTAIFHITSRLMTCFVESPNQPDLTTSQQNAVIAYGGITSDWQLIELTQNQFTLARSEKCPKWISNDVVIQTPLQLALSKTEILSNGVDSANLTITCSNPSYTGVFTVRVTPPQEEFISENVNALNGVGTLTNINTDMTGKHIINVINLDFGFQTINLEGI